MQSLLHPDQPSREPDPADLGTVLGLEARLTSEPSPAAPRHRKPHEAATDFGDLPRY
ncbi:hypothetical protein [Caldimonas thermodepolymerans]|uniref:hypothetical protein n=1 Tax=Caldimonas thermodepolymerans TaxID=215580 RepID=UPI00223691F7|nr:hypothetical protein [Caldimonas thermodepolymerans]UZG44244.1 hypothetical protein ONZ46_17985 [Caldimonas thermodepolymerans]